MNPHAQSLDYNTDQIGISLIFSGTNSNSFSATTEFIYANGSVLAGPDLPYAIQRHAMVRLHDGSVMLLGKDKQSTKGRLKLCRKDEVDGGQRYVYDMFRHT